MHINSKMAGCYILFIIYTVESLSVIASVNITGKKR